MKARLMDLIAKLKALAKDLYGIACDEALEHRTEHAHALYEQYTTAETLITEITALAESADD